MTKIRKVKRKKKYRYNVNRKRMNKKRLPDLENKTVKNAWDTHTSSQKNFKKMGIVFDVNKDIKLLNREDEVVSVQNVEKDSPAPVAQELEKTAKEGKVKNFKLPPAQVEFLTYLMDKYGDDYKAMSRDRKNYLQTTWKQLRSKINTFKRIPEQYNEYLRKKELSNKDS